MGNQWESSRQLEHRFKTTLKMTNSMSASTLISALDEDLKRVDGKTSSGIHFKDNKTIRVNYVSTERELACVVWYFK